MNSVKWQSKSYSIRIHLDEILSSTYEDIDVAVLIRVLKKTKDFEEQLVRKFSLMDGNEIELDNFAISVVTDETGKAKVEYNVGTA